MKMKWRLPGLGTQILIALVLGVLVGGVSPGFAVRLELLSQLFVRLVLMLVAPLVFSTLVVGIAGIGRAKLLTSLGLKTIGLFLGLTAVALALGIALGAVFGVGTGMTASADVGDAGFSWDISGTEPFLVRIFPSSIIDAMAQGNVLQIVVFAILFGVAVSAIGDRGEPVRAFFEALAEVMYRLTGYIMATAPLGVLGAAAAVIGREGVTAVGLFAQLGLAVGIGLALLLGGLFPALAALFGIPLRSLMVTVRSAAAIAFATASSAAALPEAMAALERWGVPRRVVGFVFPTGLSFNLAGSTLFLGVAAMFMVQMAGQTPGLVQTLELAGILFVASKGVPQVPRGSFVVLAASLASFGLSSEAIAGGVAILLSIDALLDMARTGTNVVGNCVATAVVGSWRQSTAGDMAPAAADGERVAVAAGE